MTATPNILFLIDDEHRPDVLGYAGDDTIRTPTLDWLAETGTIFTNAYTPSPVCVPARQSIRTGQLPRTWNRFDFEAFESAEYRTLPLQLARNGYMTASAGKEHYPGWNQMLGWRKRIGPIPMKQHGIGVGVGTEQSSAIPEPESGAFAGQRGFADWKWPQAKEIKRAGAGKSRAQVQDRRVVEGVQQFTKEFFSSPYYDRHQPDTPLLLKTSLIEPHYPFFAPDEDKFTYYLNRVNPYVEEPEEFHSVMSYGGRVTPGEDVSRREIQRTTAAYYAMVETIDESFGRVIESLELNGEDIDEWIIIFTSDHGEMLGERGVWGKNKFYEPSVGVPLIIRYPEKSDPKIVEENVNLCDLYATLCDFADAPVPDNRDSRSLVPLMKGKTDQWRNETISQHASNSSLQQGVTADSLMVKHGDLKYCYYGADKQEVLFDLDRDPGETTNFIDDTQYAEELERFHERREELGYGPNTNTEYKNAGYEPNLENV